MNKYLKIFLQGLKMAVGVLILTHILPLFCIVLFNTVHGLISCSDPNDWIPYFIGWFFNVILFGMYCLISFTAWCLNIK